MLVASSPWLRSASGMLLLIVPVVAWGEERAQTVVADAWGRYSSRRRCQSLLNCVRSGPGLSRSRSSP